MHSLFPLAGFVLSCLAIGGISGYATRNSITGWFATLKKPSFNPPNWVFGPVWTTLYVFMGVAAWLVWRQVGFGHAAMFLFAVQLALNFAWSFIFFNFHKLGWALVEVGVLWLAIAATIYAFAGIDSVAAWLLLPYLAWVSFASLLNYTLWRLNP